MGEHDTERMIMFSDAVIAITITLLVLELRLPGAAEMNNAELWRGFLATLPNLYAYMLSFVVIGTFWIGHRRSFSHIKRSNSFLTWLNMFLLMTLGLMPFVTGILAENGGAVGTSLYAGLIAIASLLAGGMSVYANRAGLSDPSAPRRPVWTGFASAIVFGLSIPVAIYYDADAAKLFWILLLPLGMFAGRHKRRKEDPAAS